MRCRGGGGRKSIREYRKEQENVEMKMRENVKAKDEGREEAAGKGEDVEAGPWLIT